jgi:thiopurine S-methyltransferase
LLGGLQRGATGLLITLEYDPTQMEGPPFSLDDAAVGQLYGRYAHVDLLAEQQDKPGDNLRKRGLTSLRERIYRIVRC